MDPTNLMKKLNYWKYLIVVFTFVPYHSAIAQNSFQPWVTEIEGFQYFAVQVKDFDRSMEWYKNVFGLEELDRSKADDGRWEIGNLKNDHLFVEIIRENRSTEVNRAKGFFKVGFQVKDLIKVADRIEQATGTRPRIIDVNISSNSDSGSNVLLQLVFVMNNHFFTWSIPP